MPKNNSGNVDRSGRRQALKKMALGAGAAAALPILGQPPMEAEARGSRVGALTTDADPSQSGSEWKPLFFDSHQNETVIALSELIIPATDTPGAKEAQVNRVIDLFLNDEEADAQQEFLEGLAWIDGRSLTQYKKPFIELTVQEQTSILQPLADPANRDAEDRQGVKFFQELRDATLFGYYTSQIGMEQELHYGGDQYNESFPGACTHPEHQS
ncbi:MAG TPA: gluconate 2-dehydrogenase subunit 3 family protein [Terriglobia bacterium]|nr:gluconate 2-dehydrogenase subunit 3 family protein [Terriglobia bacterium]